MGSWLECVVQDRKYYNACMHARPIYATPMIISLRQGSDPLFTTNTFIRYFTQIEFKTVLFVSVIDGRWPMRQWPRTAVVIASHRYPCFQIRTAKFNSVSSGVNLYSIVLRFLLLASNWVTPCSTATVEAVRIGNDLSINSAPLRVT